MATKRTDKTVAQHFTEIVKPTESAKEALSKVGVNFVPETAMVYRVVVAGRADRAVYRIRPRVPNDFDEEQRSRAVAHFVDNFGDEALRNGFVIEIGRDAKVLDRIPKAFDRRVRWSVDRLPPDDPRIEHIPEWVP